MTDTQPGQAPELAISVLARAGRLAQEDDRTAAVALLRSLLTPERIAALANERPVVVDGHLLMCLGCRGAGTIAAALGKAVAAAREPIPTPEEHEEATRLGYASVTAALADLGYPGDGLPCLPVPPGYELTAGGVWRTREDAEPVRVCDALMAVVGRSVDVATGDARLTLAWPYRGGWVVESVPRAAVVDARGLVAATAARGAPVDSPSAGLVCSWLRAQERAADLVLPTGRSIAHLGWSPDASGFRTNAGVIGDALDLAPPGDGEAAAGYGVTSGTLGGWIRDVWLPLSTQPGALAVVAALAAPMLRAVGAVHGFTLELAAGSGRGKSTSLDAAAAAWGPPSSIVQRWPTTKAGARESLTFRHSVPTFWDESQDVRNAAELTATALYLVGGEHGQTLGQPGGGTRAPKRIETILISTGETPSADRCADAPGALARLVSMQGDPIQQGQRELVARIQAGSRAHYGHAGPAVVRWLVEHRDQWPALAARYVEWRAHYARPGVDDQTARVGAHLALLRVAAEVMERALSVAVPEPVMHAAGAAVEAGAVERDVALTALQHAHGWWIARQHLASDKPITSGVRIGWAVERVCGGDERIAWLPAAIKECLQSNGHQPEAVLRLWHERGWLRTTDGRRTCRVTRAADPGMPRCYVWSRAAMELLEAEPSQTVVF